MSLLAIGFIIIGFVLIFVEIFFIPGFGPLGLIGGALMLVGVAITGYEQGVRTAMTYAGIATALTLPLCVFGFWILPRTRFGKGFIHSTSEHSNNGFVAGPNDLDKFLGKTGVALTPLRPAGTIEISGQRLDALTKSQFVDKGREVKIIAVEGSKIVVGEQD